MEDLALDEGAAANKRGDLAADAARELTDRIRTGLEGVYQWIKAAYQGRAWLTMGYSSWDEYVTREFGNLHLRPPKEERQEVILSMREARMSTRAIGQATNLNDRTVRRELKAAGAANAAPDQPTVQGKDGKTYAASHPSRPVEPIIEDAIDVDAVGVPVPGQLSVDEVMDLPASVAGVEPLDLAERAGVGRERVLRLLREFHGSGSAALPMTIKLASQVAGLVSPVTGRSEVPEERLHELAYDVSRGLCVLAHAAVTLRESMTSGESEAAIKANLRDSMGELDRVLRQMAGST
ncbi:DNA-binding response regulator [Microbacterium sp. A93]|uniref:DNA-binding response regulator n=1 Tax=Microbacterium sp. A93 TaxID=3450716 RepID=UPI003F43920F